MENISSNERTHIYRLNCDLLLHIFEINANMFEDYDALQTTRSASQVCRCWRSLLLETPWIWARLLDVDWPRWRRRPAPEWYAELLRRTGSAPLWIQARYALMADSSSYISRFIFAILTINWHRVERLVLRAVEPRWTIENVDLWGWVYAPAPQLKEFDVYFGDVLWSHPPSAPLFSGNAPALRIMASDHHPIDLHASWLPNLRCLDLDLPCTPSEALIALKSAKNLEYLFIGVLSVAEAGLETGVIHLSRLSQLTLNVGFEHCPFLLNHIFTPPNCSLTYLPPNIKVDQLVPHIFIPAVQALGDFAKRSLNVAASTLLVLHSDYSTLRFQYSTKSSTQNLKLMFVCAQEAEMPRNATSAILDAFTCAGFASVTDLLLHIPAGTPVDSLVAFLEHLPAVETLTTGEEELELLAKVRDRLPVREGGPAEVFPALKTIILPGQEYAEYADSLDMHSTVHAFVEARCATGRVVAVRDGEDVFRKYM
ncbi:hypothetical protein HYPSUDRAFT_36424 [Hypholoma sublateritium FD-334 SS-4]|uniref:Uncharacterized protein n=1 Tax=Hypholoma sublateritium (strain FD-334 SS-4) TaxID=945553 RepID=A0A0D2PDU7_HYPSF|nr:hypothetical protein HYPSUDRAFT_36424 [Hypholoma sublateritium FD-334 SS-4]